MIPPGVAARAVELYRSGMSARAVAAELGIDERPVLRAVREAGATRSRGRQPVVAPEQAVALHRQGLSAAEVAERLGISVRRTRAILQEHRTTELAQAPDLAVPVQRRVGGEWLILDLDALVLPVWRTMLVSIAARAAVIKHHPVQPVPRWMFGAAPGGLSVVPLPDPSGWICAVALATPAGTPDPALDGLEEAADRWLDDGGELTVRDPGRRRPRDRVRVVGARWGVEDAQAPTGRLWATHARWAQEAAVWTSVTPTAWIHPTSRQGRPRPGMSIPEQVAAICAQDGLPAPVRVTDHAACQVTGMPGTVHGDGVAYPAYTTASGAPRWTRHLTVEWDRPIRGPLILGSGSTGGYGLMTPAAGLRSSPPDR